MSKNVPLLTTLSFSGGRQSTAILWMVLLGKLSIPKNFVVLNADPGMENEYTYKYVNMMKERCVEQGIRFYTVDGPNLYEDIINLPNTNKTRLDNPPYWVNNKNKLGRLRQKCTQVYKIYPMKRKIREILFDIYGISKKSTRLGENIVETWIGFTYSEITRIKPSKTKYEYLTYPLIDMKMDNEDIIKFYNDYNLPIPPRSVCNACFANGIDTLKDMYSNRPNDWRQAVNVDKTIRDWTQIGINAGPVYVSKTLTPLEELARIDFTLDDRDKENEYSCDSGYCFL